MSTNETMNKAIESDNFNKIENIALNPKNAYVNVGKFNIFNGKFWREWEWVDISEVGKSYFDDLNGECQDYVMSLPKYKKLDYDKMVESYDNEVEKTDPYNLKDFLNKQIETPLLRGLEVTPQLMRSETKKKIGIIMFDLYIGYYIKINERIIK